MIHKYVLLFCQHLNLTDTKRKKKTVKKNKIISPDLFERNEIYCCRPLGDLFSSLRRIICVCVLNFVSLCCYLNAWTEKNALPITVLKITRNTLSLTSTCWYIFKLHIKAVVLLTPTLFRKHLYVFCERWHASSTVCLPVSNED